jgi:DNA-binding protein Fis
MEATDSVIKRKCLTLEIKQSVHRYFKNIWEVNGSNLGKMPVYRMVG